MWIFGRPFTMTTVEAGELVHVEQPAQIPATTLSLWPSI
jgi:hypothetical protein